ncbi:MAG TPA: carbamoyltransferase [bacterium]
MSKPATYILGISAYYHDSAACLVRDGEIVAAAQEERFTRKKHDAAFPEQSVRYVLREAGIPLSHVGLVTFYEKPLLKFERLLETYLGHAPSGIASFLKAMPLWMKEKLFQKRIIHDELQALDPDWGKGDHQLLFSEHHLSHAASAYYPSPYGDAAVLTMDGVGEWATTSMAWGQGPKLEIQREIRFPHSLGLLYSAFTYYTGFKVNSGEYKVMGLAPYGQPKYVQKIFDHLIDVKPDGSFLLNMEYFDYATGLRMTNSAFDRLFDGPPRKPETKLSQREMDLARSIQDATEEVMLRLTRTAHELAPSDNLCLAGGVALNCVGNGRILREGPFKHVYIQPGAGDSGGAIGAALTTWYQYLKNPRSGTGKDGMRGSYLGPAFTNDEIAAFLKQHGYPSEVIPDPDLFTRVAADLADGKVVGWFQGRMEFGPRALGGRSLLGDPRNPQMQSTMNLKIKYRESFRPFAPSVLRERVADYFELDQDSPYMLLVAPVQPKLRRTMTAQEEGLWGIDKLNVPRSSIPAVTHVDYSARVQTVHQDTNPRYYALLKAFEQKTQCPVLINTSFNVRGEPIVGSPEDAYRCFMRTGMDVLVLENHVLRKADQPEWKETGDWRNEFELD